MDSVTIKLTRGVPAAEALPAAQLAECAQAVLTSTSGRVALQYGPAGGYPALRTLIAAQVGVDEKKVIIGPGTLQLQDLCARLLLKAGDVAYVEEPTYDRTLTILRRAGARVASFPLRADGLDVDSLEARLRGGERPALFYLIPDFQNPSGSVLPAENRRRIAALAQHYGFLILEDAPYRKLRYRGQEQPLLYDLLPEQVILMSSYSKLISPGLRVGYVIAPDAWSGQLFRYAEDTYITPNYLDQAIVHEYIQRGWLDANIAKLKALYQPRLDAMLAALENHMTGLGDWHKPDGGFFIGLTLNRAISVEQLMARAQDVNLQLTDGRGFFIQGGENFIRLPFCALTPQEIQIGIERLAGVVRALQ